MNHCQGFTGVIHWNSGVVVATLPSSFPIQPRLDSPYETIGSLKPEWVCTSKILQCIIQSHILHPRTSRCRSYGFIQYPGLTPCSQNDQTTILQLFHWGVQHLLNMHQFQGTSVDSSPLALPTQTAQEYHKQHCSYINIIADFSDCPYVADLWITLKLGSSSLEIFKICRV